MMANHLALNDKAPQPVRNADGSLENFLLRIAGQPYRCQCRCNVFHKPDRENLELYECNSCGEQFEAA